MIIDTHAHYDDERFGDDISPVLSEMSENGVGKIITCSTSLARCEAVIELTKKYPQIYGAVGVYPHDTHLQGGWDKDRLKKYASEKKIVAIGEIGLDYFYDDAPRDTQKEWVVNQIKLANELDLPITFHDRDAHADTMEILKKYKPKGVIHCFSGSTQMAKEVIELGMYLGIGGVVTFKNARVSVEVVDSVPLESLVLETDAPYMAPVPMRGKTNRSDYIIYVAKKIAEIKACSTEKVLEITSANAEKIFKFEDK